MNINRSIAAFSLVLIALSGLAACSSAPSTASMEENAVTHQVQRADIDATHNTEPMKSGTAVLWVNGLGCPQCATNADLQLKRIRGVSNIRTDLGEGKIYMTIAGGSKNPSPQRFHDAIEDAGFTLVKVESF